ncbi:hypothetical protein O6H91_19G073400 [Diphasiastrum complanatum]|uniref:Uncharacterized protein n=1 Tax=Diphasiastrum complanatum TaxID=34168 RepID=A0ACC2AXG0_DIPCM|nr:hypothetical protein O6H91_19G073400 [Diphasiastrum complanatum]
MMESLVFLLLLVLLPSYIIALTACSSLEEFPGWMGETHSVKSKTGIDLSRTAQTLGVAIDPSRVTQLSWNPRAFLYKGFLTDEECDHLIRLSMVADNDSGKSVLSEIRTSSGMFLSKGQDEVVARIEDKIAAWTFFPKENGEAIQVLKYQHGEKYEPHYDYFHDKLNQALGGHRIATVLMYLSNVVKGGETVFPASTEDSQYKDDSWSDCGKRGVAVKPRKGDALLFFSLFPNATPDESSLHSGCPVIEGEKWSATKWIHVASFEKPKSNTHVCEDGHHQCGEWAAVGECTKNPAYMVGTPEWPGSCRKSCKVCETNLQTT